MHAPGERTMFLFDLHFRRWWKWAVKRADVMIHRYEDELWPSVTSDLLRLLWSRCNSLNLGFSFKYYKLWLHKRNTAWVEKQLNLNDNKCDYSWNTWRAKRGAFVSACVSLGRRTHVSEAGSRNVNKTSVPWQYLLHNDDNHNHIITVILTQTA